MTLPAKCHGTWLGGGILHEDDIIAVGNREFSREIHPHKSRVADHAQ